MNTIRRRKILKANWICCPSPHGKWANLELYSDAWALFRCLGTANNNLDHCLRYCHPWNDGAWDLGFPLNESYKPTLKQQKRSLARVITQGFVFRHIIFFALNFGDKHAVLCMQFFLLPLNVLYNYCCFSLEWGDKIFNIERSFIHPIIHPIIHPFLLLSGSQMELKSIWAWWLCDWQHINYSVS